MKKCNLCLTTLSFFIGSMILGIPASALASTEDPDKAIEIDLKPPRPVPKPKSLVIQAVRAWYSSANGELQIQTAFPQGTLLVCIENQNGAIVCQQIINGNLTQVSLFPNLAPGAYIITICGENIELCGVIEVRKMVWSWNQ